MRYNENHNNDLMGLYMNDYDNTKQDLPVSKTPFDHLFKIIIVGKSGTGKSALLKRFTGAEYDKNIRTTIGVEFGSKSIKIDTKIVKFQMWDLAGQERFHSIIRAYYRGISGVIVAIDPTDLESLATAEKYIEEIKETLKNPNIPIVLAITKSDLETNKQITDERLNEFAKKHGTECIKVSSKNNENVSEVFTTLAKKILEVTKISENSSDTNIKRKPTLPKPKFMHSEISRQAYLKSCVGFWQSHAHFEAFEKIWNDNSHQSKKAKVIALLEDYVQPNSCMAFFMRLSRKHIKDIETIIARADTKSADDIIKEVKAIGLLNVRGTLSHIIHYIDNLKQFEGIKLEAHVTHDFSNNI